MVPGDLSVQVERGAELMIISPFLSSIVTVSFWHFIKNLSPKSVSVAFALEFERACSAYVVSAVGTVAYLTSFMLATTDDEL